MIRVEVPEFSVKQADFVTIRIDIIESARHRQRACLERIDTVDVYNTSSWPRTDLIVIDINWRVPGHDVRDEEDNRVPSQLVAPGQLLFLAADIPPLGSKRFFIKRGKAGCIY